MLHAEYSSVPRIGANYTNLAFLTITFLGIGILIWKTTKAKKKDEKISLI
jgi:hypothetical protein